MKKLVPVLVGLGLVAAFALTLVFLAWKAMEPPEVAETESPKVTDIEVKTVAAGSVVPRNEVDIKSRVSGIVDEVAVEPGELVKAGDLIAAIRIVPDVVTLNDASSALQTARIELDQAKVALERAEKLRSQGAISEAELERAATDARLRQERFDAATSNLELVREGVSRRTGNVSTQVRSTVDGMVLVADIEPGQSVIESNTFNEGTTIAVVADMGDMVFEGNVDESEVGKLREGMEIAIEIGAISGKRFPATLEYIAPRGVLADGAVQFEIRAALTVPDDVFVRAGSSANADIVLDRATQVLAVRESTLRFDGQRVLVDVETRPGFFEPRAIEIGLSDGIHVEVRSGLTEGDRVKRGS